MAIKLTSIRKVVLQSGWPPIQWLSWVWINSTESFSNPQQLNLSWISVFCLMSRLFHAALRTVSSTFVVWGRARTAADTANNTKPVSPSTTMYYSSKSRKDSRNNDKDLGGGGGFSLHYAVIISQFRSTPCQPHARHTCMLRDFTDWATSYCGVHMSSCPMSIHTYCMIPTTCATSTSWEWWLKWFTYHIQAGGKAGSIIITNTLLIMRAELFLAGRCIRHDSCSRSRHVMIKTIDGCFDTQL